MVTAKETLLIYKFVKVGVKYMKRAIGISLILLVVVSGFCLYLPTPNATPYSTPDTGVTWTMDDLVANSGGTVTGSTGTYVITDHVNISKNDTLIINPSEIIKFDSGVNLTIYGTLIAVGEESNRITFTSNSSSPSQGDWGCLIFEDTSSDANCIINNSRFEYSTYGIICEQASPRITNNTITMNMFFGIVLNASYALIENNTISSNMYGIICGYPSTPVVINNQISNNFLAGIFCSDSNAEIDNNTISGSLTGIMCAFGAPTIKNCTISSIDSYAILCTNATGINITENTLISGEMIFYNSSINTLRLIDSTATTVNCTYPIPNFNIDSNSILVVRNYLHVKVIDDVNNPIQGAWVNVTDEGSQIFSRQTEADGFVRWIDVTDRIYYYGNVATENRTGISVENGSMSFSCLTSPDPTDINMFTSHLEIFQGSPGFAIYLEHGWNLISIPLIQSDTNLGTVLSSITGSYDSVWVFNVSDYADHWKHNHTSKPSHMNDLDDIDRTMGFWICVTELGGVLFVFPGTEPTEDQNITLYPGWNLVGYPSLSSYNRTDGLNNLTFGSEVNAICSYDAAMQNWERMGEFDNFEYGKGYWIYANDEVTWEVPL